MKTLYAACLSRLGLSQAEAAALHNVALATVKSWATGRNRIPQGVWDEFRGYETKIINGAEEMREQWIKYGSPLIEINDAESGGTGVMALAEFVLSSTGPISVGVSAATQMARQARRPN